MMALSISLRSIGLGERMKDFQEIATELVIRLWHCNEESFQQASFQWYRDTIQEALSEAFAHGRKVGLCNAIDFASGCTEYTTWNSKDGMGGCGCGPMIAKQLQNFMANLPDETKRTVYVQDENGVIREQESVVDWSKCTRVSADDNKLVGDE